MKYILILFVLVLSSLSIAQTPALYDEWTPNFGGKAVHIVISSNEISVTMPSSHKGAAPFITMTVPSENSSSLPQETLAEKNAPRIEKCPLLKVTFDSLQAKGRMFITEHNSKYITVLPFVIKDDGEMVIGCTYMRHGVKTLKEAEKESRMPSKDKYSQGFMFSLYNKTKVAEFGKLKDPSEMPKEEAMGMISSLGNRIAAMLQKDENALGAMGAYGLLFGEGQKVIQDLFIAHGYNPLHASAAYEKFQADKEVEAAFKELGKKIEESTPALREMSKYRNQYKSDSRIEATDSTMTAAPAPAPAPAPPPPEAVEYHDADRMQKVEMPVSNSVDVAEMKDERVPSSQTDYSKDPGRDEFIDITTEPKPIQNIQALVKYPEDAKRAGVEGRVAYSVLIGKDGKVLKVVIEQSDNAIFNQAVIDAVKKVRFTPAKSGKQSVKVWYSQSVNFKLN